ncbi:MAG TPA: oligosaccharide flippase family protein [Thermoleophilaceae bacterium]|nr:oligosaccharide flippase family protein [Thermoleophilaceae bacterium]
MTAADAGPAVGEATDEATLHAPPARVGLRALAARGTIVNAAFEIGLAALGAFKGIAVAAFLTRTEFGLWGVILPIITTLIWLKQIGVADKYVQQEEPDQEAEWQHAFTLELLMSTAFFLLMCIVFPLYSLAYGHPGIILPGLVLASSVVISALESPSWIPYRRMQFGRQRVLTVIDPVLSIVITIALGAAGLGYWSLVWGAVGGSVAGAIVCVWTCPYRIRLRFDFQRLESYFSFSWPLLGGGFSRMLVVQGSLLTANRTIGLAGIGAIGLATTIATFSDRADRVVSASIYPAVCRIRDRVETMAEAYVKSNRIALMWAMPFAVGVALFAGDFVDYVLGSQWRPAVGLMIAIALTCGLAQVGFNWGVFMRAVDNTKPLFVAALLDLGVFFVVAIPGMVLFGLAGYAAGFAASVIAQLAIRGWFMHRMFPGFNVLRQLTRGMLPVVPPAALILVVRAIVPDGRSPARAIAETGVYALAVIATTYLFERPLIAESLGYLRRAPRSAAAPAT